MAERRTSSPFQPIADALYCNVTDSMLATMRGSSWSSMVSQVSFQAIMFRSLRAEMQVPLLLANLISGRPGCLVVERGPDLQRVPWFAIATCQVPSLLLYNFLRYYKAHDSCSSREEHHIPHRSLSLSNCLEKTDFFMKNRLNVDY
jgi:hypothetical protein